ncbi:glyoxalase superfamily protein [Mangrovivirga cuniculi]|uniref:Glyoxalase n=1 Tax=Mangrovivirga cuniculi TaxID=2715131 RepID=A0A4D7JL35_9BACT|nr:glyoxalase superfamily protein [Mangrovivirga cuniculi]QCK16589.1 glyoxalase [Mangrovivirga cuniculi]
MDKYRFSHCSTIIPVTNMESSLFFYTDKLNFNIEFTWENPVSYAILSAGDNINIHLSLREGQTKEIPSPVLYIFISNIDNFYNELKEKKLHFHNPLGNRDYKMRDFDVVDPDQNIITFGEGI